MVRESKRLLKQYKLFPLPLVAPPEIKGKSLSLKTPHILDKDLEGSSWNQPESHFLRRTCSSSTGRSSPSCQRGESNSTPAFWSTYWMARHPQICKSCTYLHPEVTNSISLDWRPTQWRGFMLTSHAGEAIGPKRANSCHLTKAV